MYAEKLFAMHRKIEYTFMLLINLLGLILINTGLKNSESQYTILLYFSGKFSKMLLKLNKLGAIMVFGNEHDIVTIKYESVNKIQIICHTMNLNIYVYIK